MPSEHDNDQNKPRRSETRRRIIIDGKEVEIVEVTYSEFIEESEYVEPHPLLQVGLTGLTTSGNGYPIYATLSNPQNG